MYKMNRIFVVSIVMVLCSVTAFSGSKLQSIETASISNGFVEVRVDAANGSFDIIDLKNGQTIISDSRIGFSIAPYVDLEDVAEDAFETDHKSIEFTVESCGIDVNNDYAIRNAFSGGSNNFTHVLESETVPGTVSSGIGKTRGKIEQRFLTPFLP